MHRPLFLLTAGSAAAVGALVVASALPAGAATAGRAETMAFTACPTDPAVPGCADTTVTFSVQSTGTLAITAPTGPVDLGKTVAGSVSGTGTAPTNVGSDNDFGPVTVIDTRGLGSASWTATVSSTDFLNISTNVSNDTIPVADASYLTGAVVATPTCNGDTITVSCQDATAGPVLGSSALSVHTTTPITLAHGTGTGGTTGTSIVTETGFDGDNSTQWTPEIAVAVPANAVVGTYEATVTHSVT